MNSNLALAMMGAIGVAAATQPMQRVARHKTGPTAIKAKQRKAQKAARRKSRR